LSRFSENISPERVRSASAARESDGSFYVLKSLDGNPLAADRGFSTDFPIAACDAR
jgi:hypothetical protein